MYRPIGEKAKEAANNDTTLGKTDQDDSSTSSEDVIGVVTAAA